MYNDGQYFIYQTAPRFCPNCHSYQIVSVRNNTMDKPFYLFEADFRKLYALGGSSKDFILTEENYFIMKRWSCCNCQIEMYLLL